MEVDNITLPTGIRQPQCQLCGGQLFCRDLRLEHRLQASSGSQLALSCPSMATQTIGRGIRYCSVTCAHCRQRSLKEPAS